MNKQWLIVGAGGSIQLLNAEGSYTPSDPENWALFKVEADNFGIRINCVSAKKDIVYNPAGANPL